MFAILLSIFAVHASDYQSRCDRLAAFRRTVSVIDNSARHEFMAEDRHFTTSQTALLYDNREELNIRVLTQPLAHAQLNVLFKTLSGQNREQQFAKSYLRGPYDLLDRELKEGSQVSRYLVVRIEDPATRLRLAKRELKLNYFNGAPAFTSESVGSALAADDHLGPELLRRSLIYETLEAAGVSEPLARVSPWQANSFRVNLTNLTHAELDTILNQLAAKLERGSALGLSAK